VDLPVTAVAEGKQPILCRDYFWTFFSLAEFPSLALGRSDASVYATPPPYTPASGVMRVELMRHALDRLRLLLQSHAGSNQVPLHQLEVLLKQLRWRLYPVEKDTICVSSKYAATVKKTNYQSFKLGEEYFMLKDPLFVDYLRVSCALLTLSFSVSSILTA
jgi:hypothetical protein